MLTGCGSFSESRSAVTAKSEISSSMMESDISVSSVTSDQPSVTDAGQQEEKKSDSMQITNFR